MYPARVWKPRNAAWLAVCALIALSAAPQAMAQLLNGGFETDAFLDQEPVPFVSDWSGFGGFFTTSANLNPARTGVGALQLVGGGAFGVPGAFQTFPATPGQVWDLQGYMRTNEALPAGATFGLLKIVFGDGAVDLEPAAVNIGQLGPAANPGVEALPFLNSASEVGTWQFAHAQGVAPAGTIEVRLFALFVDENPGTVYFDDLQGGLVTVTTPGDFNGDSKVDSVDLGLWSAAYATTDVGDADDDGDTDGNDFLIWQRNVTASPASAVPEPGAFVVAATGLALLAGASRRRDW